jgi:predicted nucleic acid-binding Zn ribbon protein
MTPEELERLGIAITGTTHWIAALAKLMGFRQSSVVRKWWTGKTKITAPKQRKLLLLAGQPDTPPSPVSDHTRSRLARIMAMREQGYIYPSIGMELNVSPQAVRALVRHYRVVTPKVEMNKLQCPVCSVTFRPKTRRQVYCSRRCGKVRWYLLHRESTPRDPKLCLRCGASFQPTQPTAKYCSRRCRNNHRARQYRQRLRAMAAA